MTLKSIMLPYGLVGFEIRFVLENACIKPWYFKFLSTYRVFRYLESTSVKSIIYNNSNINFIFVWIICIRILLVLDTLLHILIVQVKLIYAVICSICVVVVLNNFFKSFFFLVRFLFIVNFLLDKVFLKLLYIFVGFQQVEKNTSKIKRFKTTILLFPLFLKFFK